jgi:transcriptional regulator GlxA family with amidase domain
VGQVNDTAGRRRRRELFAEALSLIERSYGNHRLTVEGLSREIFCSRRQLERAFAEAGTSVRGRLHAVRMQRAAELLHHSSLSVARVARSVGYLQPPQFAQAFRRYYALTPSQWRTKGPDSRLAGTRPGVTDRQADRCREDLQAAA